MMSAATVESKFDDLVCLEKVAFQACVEETLVWAFHLHEPVFDAPEHRGNEQIIIDLQRFFFLVLRNLVLDIRQRFRQGTRSDSLITSRQHSTPRGFPARRSEKRIPSNAIIQT